MAPALLSSGPSSDNVLFRANLANRPLPQLGDAQATPEGVVHIERETLDAALMSGRSVLEQLGWEPHHARTLSLRFRRHNVSQVLAMAPHWKDEARLLTAAKQGRQQLEEQFAKEREAAHPQRIRAGWTAQPSGEPVSGAEGERTLGEEDSPTGTTSPHQ